MSEIRICDADGTVHFTSLKRIDHETGSGVQYLHAVNNPTEPTRDMLIGTIVHQLLLGPRANCKPIVVYRGGIRRGERWEKFQAEFRASEIVSESEWDAAEQIAESVRADPLAQRYLSGARTEVPLVWDEGDVRCSTSGIDLICPEDDVGDLKTVPTTCPTKFLSHAFRMFYPHQIAFYLRGLRANGLPARQPFILGVERKAPFEVVPLHLTPEMVTEADKLVTKWLDRYRQYRLLFPRPTTVKGWPGYTPGPVVFDVPAWKQAEDEDDLDEEAAA